MTPPVHRQGPSPWQRVLLRASRYVCARAGTRSVNLDITAKQELGEQDRCMKHAPGGDSWILKPTSDLGFASVSRHTTKATAAGLGAVSERGGLDSGGGGGGGYGPGRTGAAAGTHSGAGGETDTGLRRHPAHGTARRRAVRGADVVVGGRRLRDGAQQRRRRRRRRSLLRRRRRRPSDSEPLQLREQLARRLGAQRDVQPQGLQPVLRQLEPGPAGRQVSSPQGPHLHHRVKTATVYHTTHAQCTASQ